MIFITAKFKVRPEHADNWLQITSEFTQATRDEPGCLWFDWSRSVADPQEYVLVEAFRGRRGRHCPRPVGALQQGAAVAAAAPGRDAEDRELRDPPGRLVR